MLGIDEEVEGAEGRGKMLLVLVVEVLVDGMVVCGGCGGCCSCSDWVRGLAVIGSGVLFRVGGKGENPLKGVLIFMLLKTLSRETAALVSEVVVKQFLPSAAELGLALRLLMCCVNTSPSWRQRLVAADCIAIVAVGKNEAVGWVAFRAGLPKRLFGGCVLLLLGILGNPQPDVVAGLARLLNGLLGELVLVLAMFPKKRLGG